MICMFFAEIRKLCNACSLTGWPPYIKQLKPIFFAVLNKNMTSTHLKSIETAMEKSITFTSIGTWRNHCSFYDSKCHKLVTKLYRCVCASIALVLKNFTSYSLQKF